MMTYCQLDEEVEREHGDAGRQEAPPEHRRAVERHALLDGEQHAANG